VNERIEKGYCNPLAPVATYRARFPQQSATSAVWRWLVLYSGQYVSKFLNGGQPFKQLQKKKVGMDGQSTIRLICRHITRINLIYQYYWYII